MTPSITSVPLAHSLWRIGERPHAGDFHAPAILSKYKARDRFDDPKRRFRVLYAAEKQRGALLETLAEWRPDVKYLAERKRRKLAPEQENTPHISWFDRRDVALVHVRSTLPFLDLRAIESREAVRGELAPTLRKLRLSDFDLSDATGKRRMLTQEVAGWAYDRGWGGVIYPSRLEAEQTCWAIFDHHGTQVTTTSTTPLDVNQTQVREVLGLFKIRIAF